MDSLLDFPTLLEKLVGVDISQKSLSRAAKVNNLKLFNCDSYEQSLRGLEYRIPDKKHAKYAGGFYF